MAISPDGNGHVLWVYLFKMSKNRRVLLVMNRNFYSQTDYKQYFLGVIGSKCKCVRV